MSVPTASHKFSYTYTNDAGVSLNITLSVGTASAGSFAAGALSQGNWGPHKARNKLRGVHGTTADGTQHAFLPCPTQASLESIFSAGQFTIADNVYIITGRRGERVSVNRLPS